MAPTKYRPLRRPGRLLPVGIQTSGVRTIYFRASVAGPLTTGARPDVLAVEEALDIRTGNQSFTVTMRTPGHDIDLALGLLVAEGVVRTPHDVVRVRELRLERSGPFDVTAVVADLLPDSLARATERARSSLTTSACGACGTAARNLLPASCSPADDNFRVDPHLLASLPNRLRDGQRVFARTGGLHAAGLFRSDGTPLVVREDVGRHNAVDKVVGWAYRAEQLPLIGSVLVVSGRASFELVSKSITAGIPVLVAVSAPSSMAVALAREAGLTLLGFARDGGANVYAGAHRLGLDDQG